MAKGRVLLAHANADCRKIYGSVLVFDGYDVETVSDGDAALQLLASVPFDLVVTDLYLPSTVDECLLRYIRGQEYIAHLPVIVITAWTTELHERVARRELADAFLPLPLRPRDLVDVAARLVARPPAPIAPPHTPVEREDHPIANGL